MKTYRYTIGMLPNVVLPLGIQGENLAREIRIDYTEWVKEGFSGVPQIAMLSPDGTIMPVITSTEQEEDPILGVRNIIVWPIVTNNTREYGAGYVRVSLINGTIVLKSTACRFLVEPSILRDLPDAPADFNDWMDMLQLKAAACLNGAEDAIASAESAADSAERAEAYAEIIQGAKPSIMNGLMNLSTSMAVNLPEEQWDYSSTTGMYSIVRSNPIITSGTSAILMLNETDAEKCQACIEMETTSGNIRFSTAVKPSDDISGTLILQGRFADAGISGVAVKRTLSIATNAWNSSKQCTVSCPGMTSDLTVIVSPSPSSFADCSACGVYCSDQGTDTLTFKAGVKPTNALNINVLGL